MGNKPEIMNVEWALVIAALFAMDAIQWGLILLFGIGLILDPFIDIFVGLSFALYLWIRGQVTMHGIIALVVGFLGEEGSDGAIPLWGLEGLYQMFLSKSGSVLAQVPGGAAIQSAIENVE
jgi:hypothetical protein